MYCRNCGNEIFETDKFCWKCGEKVINNDETTPDNANNLPDDKEKLNTLINKLESEQQNNTSQFELKKDSIKSETLPMNWWNFWKYFRFPAGCIVSCLNLVNYQNYTFDFYIASFFIIDILRIILMGFSYYQFLERKKNGYKLFNIFLALDSIYICAFSALKVSLKDLSTNFVVNFVVLLIAMAIIWVFPNYIYFKKRKKYFCN